MSEKISDSFFDEAAKKRERHLASIEFVGFTEEQISWITRFLEHTKLPLSRVRAIALVPFTSKEDFLSDSDSKTIYDSVATSGTYSADDQTIRINQEWLRSVPQPSRTFALRTLLVHELAHSFNPLEAYWETYLQDAGEEVHGWLQGASQQYENRKTYEELATKLVSVSNQILATKVYLDGYSRTLARELDTLTEGHKKGAVTEEEINLNNGLFVSEIHAILIELLFRNPTHLATVDAACRLKYQLLPAPKEPYVSIVETAYAVYQAVTGVGMTGAAAAIAQSALHTRTNPF